jgi:MoaD family protein
VTVTLRLFAAAREAAGRGRQDFEHDLVPTVGALLDAATEAYGPTFALVLRNSRVWVNGDEPAGGPATVLADGDEVAVLPPVSGGIA